MGVDQALAAIIRFSLISRKQTSDAVRAGRRAIGGHHNGLPDLESMFRHFLDHPGDVSSERNSGTAGLFC